jgi:hypothetical protein
VEKVLARVMREFTKGKEKTPENPKPEQTENIGKKPKRKYTRMLPELRDATKELIKKYIEENHAIT